MGIFIKCFRASSDIFIIGLAGYCLGTGEYIAASICAGAFVIGIAIEAWLI